MIAVLRYSSNVTVEQNLLDSTVAELMRATYERTASLKKAPAITDCVTAIHYFVRKVFQIELPRAWVGDMPRLLSQSNWNLHIIAPAALKIGDLLFLKGHKQTQLISHVAIALSPHQIFHCTARLGPVIQSIDQVFEHYEQPLQQAQVTYIDSRNRALR